MNTFTKRVATGAAIAAGILGAGAGVGFAASPLSSADARPGGASATAAGVPGVVTVNDGYAQGGYETGHRTGVSHVTLAGESLIGHEGNGNWTGTLSAAGSVIDTVNGALCMGGVAAPGVSDDVVVCARVLGYDGGTNPYGSGMGADLASALVTTEGGETGETFTGVQVAPSSAATFGGCTAGAASVAVVHSHLLDDTLAIGTEADEHGCDFGS